MTSTSLAMTAAQHQALRDHLFPGDGKEAVAVLLCGRRSGDLRHRLVVHELLLVPYERCQRDPDRLRWPTDVLDPLLARATRQGFALVKLHSHPTGYPAFSATDDTSDRELFPSVYAWVDRPEPHASAIMLPEGRVFGRVVREDGSFVPLESVSVIGDDIITWRPSDSDDLTVPAHAQRLAQAFGKKTFMKLRKLRVAVVGCSGTGSIIIEQLARNCVGSLVLVDPEDIEDKNLNRILNSKKADVAKAKVDVMLAAVKAMGLGTEVVPLAMDITDPRAARAVAQCDVVFGCVDGTVGRHVLNRIASFYVMPYFDVGVKLAVDDDGNINRAEATANYMKPGGSSLLSRGLYTQDELGAEWLKRGDPDEYERRRAERYIKGVAGDQPAVISINMLAASLGVNDFLARIHGFRDVENRYFERQILSLFLGLYTHEEIPETCALFAKLVGRGDEVPLLGLPEFGGER